MEAGASPDNASESVVGSVRTVRESESPQLVISRAVITISNLALCPRPPGSSPTLLFSLPLILCYCAIGRKR